MVKCKGCEFCTPCPAGIRIPEVLQIYRRFEEEDRAAAQRQYAQLTQKADACIRCGRCEKLCPQHIGISAMMLEISEEMEAR